MKRLLHPLLIISVIIYWGCEDKTEPPTEVTLWGEVYSVEDTDTLFLYNNQITGVIPPEIGNLTNLTFLDLYGNQFSGEIPSEIGNLTNLTFLDLYGNQFSGEIPSEIGNLTNLTHLWLDGNELTGEIPSEIGNLTNPWSGQKVINSQVLFHRR